ncbi:E3 ubiquitin-protein ligase RNF14-like protein [Leptotrombidium deliense]|uniref:RBR-type E3 ubiquitin transferase n=1 Tax=Leptotrombidium deliense TaxID=299467 RepID=A0A443SMH0_9ACAR|nr:E3 ubiquitin-protein ligase RNF14-like protein [Leptotrombidium deliense]
MVQELRNSIEGMVNKSPLKNTCEAATENQNAADMIGATCASVLPSNFGDHDKDESCKTKSLKPGIQYDTNHLVEISPETLNETKEIENNRRQSFVNRSEVNKDENALFVKFWLSDVSNELSMRSLFTKFGIIRYTNFETNARGGSTGYEFSKFGTIQSTKVVRHWGSKWGGYGFVCFEDHVSAKTAVDQMNNTFIQGHRLIVKRANCNFEKKNELSNQFQQQRNFHKSTYTNNEMAKNTLEEICIVCFTETLSSETINLECRHIICKECIALYIRHLVDNKQVESVICPKDGCDCELTFYHISTIVPKDLLNEFDKCLMDNYLNKKDDIVWCPQAHCRFPVFLNENMTEGRCPKCKLAFCAKCGEQYHGIRECNEFVDEHEKKQVLHRYMNGSETEKAMLQRKYTKNKLEKEVENLLSNQCINRKCKQCPNCKVNIEKNEGCNKIICTKCKSYFCWLCLQIINKSDPYKHYNDGGSKCKLFPRYRF